MAREDIHELGIGEITEKLRELPGWAYEENKISKEFKFKDFLSALGFINSLADFFEKNDHHPDMHIFYSKILFELTRWDIGGKVTNLDIKTAEEIERAFKELK